MARRQRPLHAAVRLASNESGVHLSWIVTITYASGTEAAGGQHDWWPNPFARSVAATYRELCPRASKGEIVAGTVSFR